MSNLPRIEDFLAEDERLRRLARQLVSDPHQADDLVQDAWIRMFSGGVGVRTWRPWLGGVLRNLVRSSRREDRRRDVRERAAARPEALPSAAELVEELTVRNEVTRQLLELEEPYRTTLYLRYFRDVPPRKIAQAMGVSPSTINERLLRGQEKLRLRLDRSCRGGRDAWAGVLLAPARLVRGLATTSTASTGGILMSTTLKVAASLVVVGGAIGIWSRAGEPTGLTPASLEVSEAAQRRLEGGAPALADAAGPDRAGSERVEAAPGASVVEPAPEATPEPAAAGLVTLRGRVLDTSQQPVAGIEVGFRAHGETRPRAVCETDASGAFALEHVAPAVEQRTMALFDRLAGGELLVDDPVFARLAIGIVGAEELVLVVGRRHRFAGVVVDDGGGPVAAARMAVRMRPSLFRDAGLAQFTSYCGPGQSTETDPSGTFTLEGVCGGEHVYLSAASPGHGSAELPLPDEDRSDLVVVLDRAQDTIDVAGRVVDDDGAPVPDARVSMGHRIVQTDATGDFIIHWNRTEALTDESFGREGTRVAGIDEPLHIAALKPGHAPARLELAPEDLALPVLLRLGPRPLSISGRVVDEAGEPRPGVVVWARDLTPFGNRSLELSEYSTRLAMTIEEELAGGWRHHGTVTDEHGAFELGGLASRSYDLQVVDSRSAAAGEGWRIAAGAHDVELVLEDDASVERVAGRIVSARGLPIPGVAIRVGRAALGAAGGTHPEPPEDLLRKVTTGADGSFEFPALATEGTRLDLAGDTIFLHSVALEDFGDLDDMEIVVPVLCELRLELEGDALGPDAFRVLDETGEPVTVIVPYGNLGNVMTRDVDVDAGPSGVCRVPETGRTLALLRDGVEVARRRLQLDPGERTVVR